MPSSQRLPNTLSISIKGLNSSRLLATLSDRLAASAGAACHAQDADGGGHAVVSSVLSAMGVSQDYAMGTLRLSVGRHSVQEDVDTAVRLILEEAGAQGIMQRKELAIWSADQLGTFGVCLKW